MDMGLGGLQVLVMDREAWHAVVAKSRIQLSDWTELNWVKGYGFSSSHVWMWELDYKERWVPKNWCFWTVVLVKTLESPLDYKEIQPVHPKGNQSWIFTGRTDVEAETPILWPPDVKNWLIWKEPDAGKEWRSEEKGTTEDEMVGWHHQLSGHEFEQASGLGDGWGSLACCSPWGCSQTLLSDWTELSSVEKPVLLDSALFFSFQTQHPFFINH